MILFLLIIGVLLVIFNFKALKKERSSFNNIFHTTEEDMKEFEVRLGEVRREFSETILELQKEIQQLKKNKMQETDEEEYKESKKLSEEISMEAIGEEVDTETFAADEEKSAGTVDIKIDNKYEKNTERNSVKIEEINKLLGKGLSIEEVSIKLGIGKGEVLLIKELYLK